MEEPIIPKKISFLSILSILMAIVFIYALVYTVLRLSHEMVHRHQQHQHSVEVIIPEGQELYLSAIRSSSSPEKTDAELQKSIRYYQNKKKYMESIFQPARTIETWVWEMGDPDTH